MQPPLLPLKKAPGKHDKNFKRPQPRANGAVQGAPERPKPPPGEPGIERYARACISYSGDSYRHTRMGHC